MAHTEVEKSKAKLSRLRVRKLTILLIIFVTLSHITFLCLLFQSKRAIRLISKTWKNSELFTAIPFKPQFHQI